MSEPSQAQFAGASGEYYVAAVLAYERLHVGMVRQGGQSIDLLVSTADGSRSTTIQVKSRGRAHKKRKDGVIVGYDWFIGKKVFDQDPALLYVLVDLKEWAECTPDVFPMRAVHRSRPVSLSKATTKSAPSRSSIVIALPSATTTSE